VCESVPLLDIGHGSDALIMDLQSTVFHPINNTSNEGSVRVVK